MTDHYYSKTPSSKSDPTAFEVHALGVSASFNSDAGVFSKDGLDYGSRLLLESLPEIKGRALDLGCGWGALGVIIAKKYRDAEVVMSDINERAVALAGRAISENGLRNARAVQSDGFEAVDGTFDVVITNPPIRAGKAVIYALFDQARERIRPGGALYIVIRKQHGAPSALKHLSEVYTSAEVIARDKGFWIIRAGV